MPDWSNQPPVDPTPYGGSMAGANACPDRSGVWEITSAVAWWAANPAQSFGLEMRTDEGDNSAWKKWSSVEGGGPPRLDVTYNHAPITPVAVSPAHGTHVIGSATTASATYADADGGSGYIAFGVWNANSTLVWSAWSPPVCTWCATSVARTRKRSLDTPPPDLVHYNEIRLRYRHLQVVDLQGQSLLLRH